MWVHGKDTRISIDGQDVSPWANASELSRKGETHNVTTYGSANYPDGRKPNVYHGGLVDGTGKVSGVYDDTASTGPAAILRPLIGTTVVLQRRVEGDGIGKPQEVVDVIVTDYTESSPVADMVTWSCEFQCSGVIDDAPQAA